MDIASAITAVFIACGFVGWPIVGSYAKVSGGWMGTLVAVSTAITMAVLFSKHLGNIPVPGTKSLILLLIAGVVNGLALYLYSNKVADSNIPTAAFVVMISIMMAVVAPVLNWLLNNAVPNMNQLLGFGFAVVAIYFLSR